MTMGIVLVACLAARSVALRARGDNHVDLETHQLGRELREALDVARGSAELDDEVLALHVAQLSQSLRRPRTTAARGLH